VREAVWQFWALRWVSGASPWSWWRAPG